MTSIISLPDLFPNVTNIQAEYVEKSTGNGSNNYLSVLLSNKTVIFVPCEIHRYGVTPLVS